MAKTPTKTTAKAPAARKAPVKKAAAAPKADAKAKFAKAIEEAKAGATALSGEARAKATALTGEAKAKAGAYKERLAAKSEDWAADAKDLAAQAKDRAGELAKEGKAKTSDAIASLGKIVSDNAGTIDEKLGTRYGDYARTAARSMQETAAKIEAKDLGELGEDAKKFVREKPAVAIGLAAVVGFFVARLFRGGSSDEA